MAYTTSLEASLLNTSHFDYKQTQLAFKILISIFLSLLIKQILISNLFRDFSTRITPILIFPIFKTNSQIGHKNFDYLSKRIDSDFHITE